MNRIIPLLIFMLLASTIKAETGSRHSLNGLCYEVLTDSTVAVGKISDKQKPVGVVEIPERVTLKGSTYTVNAIDGWGFFDCNQITRLVMPNTIDSIGPFALCRCEGLTEIDIPSSVKRMSYAVFENCTGLTSITLPSSITRIEERLFQECANLREVNLPPTITSIGSSAFSRCRSLERITLPDAITDIDNYAFAFSKSLKHIDLPRSLQSIGEAAFSGCAFREIILPEGLTSLGENAFRNCVAMERLMLPSSLRQVSGNPFTSCDSLTSIIVTPGEGSLITIDGILYSADMTKLIACPMNRDCGNIVVPASVKEIMPSAFCDCKKLTGLKMTAVEHIGEAAFLSTKITTLDLGHKLQTIGKEAFGSCHYLTEVRLPDSVKELMVNAFGSCSELRTVSVSEKLSKNEEGFNTLVFQMVPKDIKFIVRKKDGSTYTLRYDQIPDLTKRFLPY